MNRVLNYEINNITFGYQYPDGIKCKNYELGKNCFRYCIIKIIFNNEKMNNY
jgi:hypothetical protein